MGHFMDITRGTFIRSTLAPLLLAAGVAGCTPPAAIHNAFSQVRFHAIPRHSNGELDLVRTGYSLSDALVAELRKSHPSFDPNVPILVTSFVNRANLDSTSELGLIISDHVASRLTQHGFTILEPKLRQDLSIRLEEGEFLLSRDIERLHPENGAYAAVVGSYTETLTSVNMTAKIVEIRDRKVLASVDVKMPLGSTSRGLLLETSRKIRTQMEVVAQ